MALFRFARQMSLALGQTLSHQTGSSSVCLSVNTARPTVLSTCRSTLHQSFHSLRSSGLQGGHHSLLGTATDSHHISQRFISLEYMHRKGKYKKEWKKKNTPLDGAPMLKGVVLKTLIKKPKKPNSANRKCVKLRLSNGKEALAHVPGEGHNLQEHNVVLVQGGRLQDTPGVKLTCIRGKFDLPHVKKKTA